METINLPFVIIILSCALVALSLISGSCLDTMDTTEER